MNNPTPSEKRKELDNCSGCTDRHSEGTHQFHTTQHPCPEGGDPNCGYCFPAPSEKRCCEVCIDENTYRSTEHVTPACKNANCTCHQQALTQEGVWEQYTIDNAVRDITSVTVARSKSAVHRIIEKLLSSQKEGFRKEIEGMKKNAKWFEDNYFTTENAFPTYNKEEYKWVTVTAKETYNLALNDVLRRMNNLD